MSKVDFRNKDYRGFIFALHEVHGLLLLQCDRKKNKPVHWQLPGGHIDEFEFIEAAKESDDYETQLVVATKRGAARELFEETGMDVRKQLDRLNPAGLRPSATLDKSHKPVLVNEYKHRLFYFLLVSDDDFPKNGKKAMGSVNLRLTLSEEHSGFTFQSEPMIAAEMLEKHSGGKVSEALRMSMASSSKPGAVNLDMKGSTATPFTNTHSNEAEPNENCATTAAPTATGNSEEIKSSPYLESENDSGPLIDGEISVKEHLKQQYGTTSKAAANNHEMLHHGGNNREGDNIGTSPIPLVPALPQKKGFLCCLGWDPLCSKPDKERKYRLDH